MPHPRAQYPPQIAEDYRNRGGHYVVREYRTSWQALRRWLVENGIPLHEPGVRPGTVRRKKKEVAMHPVVGCEPSNGEKP